MAFNLDVIVSWAKRKAFVFPGSDIYWGLANAWDYWPYWVALKNNVRDLWWKTFVQEREDMVGLDAQILMHPKVWEASGHVAWFNDPLIDDKKTWERFRADKIIEDDIEKKRKKQDESALKSYVLSTYWFSNLIPESWGFEWMHKYILWEKIRNPNGWGEADWTEVRKFQMMFYTYQGVIHNDDAKIWMRPETAQGIFVNFKNIIDTMRVRLPFWVAQVGKSFRNEITPWNFLYRTREFEQMEIEYFLENDKEKWMVAFKKWQEASMTWRRDILKLNSNNLRFREHEQDELSHYSAWTFDVEYKYPWGWGELQGIAYRTDFDLKQHQQVSGKDMQYTDPYSWARFIPHVIEPSFGLNRMLLAVLLDSYDEEKYTDGNGNEQERVVVRFNKLIAPVKFAILPLVEKSEGMLDIAEKLFRKLSKSYSCELDVKWNIGKRYRRQDEIGTPFCLTIDNQSLEDWTVTIRDRDTMQQKRINLDEINLDITF